MLSARTRIAGARQLTQKDSRAPQSNRTPSQAFVLLTAAWFALVVSWGELAGMTAAWYLANVYVYNLGIHLVWMAPVANLLLFALVGILLLCLVRVLPRIATTAVVVGVLLFVAALAFACMFDRRLYWSALLLMCGGVAVQGGMLAGRYATRFQALVYRSLPILVAFTALVAITGLGARRWQEARAIAQLPPATPGAPNVLFLVLDAVRAKNLSVYGYERPTTPNLQNFAAKGVLFEWPFAPSSWSLPSHSSFLTGRYPYELSAAVRVPLDDTHPTLAEVLRSRGYTTSGFVANMGYTARRSGLSRGFVHYEDFSNSVSQVLGAPVLVRTGLHRAHLRDLLNYYQLPGRKSAERINRDFLSWQQKHADRPFFTFINYFDAHAPYVPPEEFEGRFGSNKGIHLLSEQRSIDVNAAGMRRQIQAQVDAYDNLVAYLDHSLGQLFDELDRRGILDNTIVVVTSDHGEEFGEHGHLGHGAGMNTSELHVPLILVAESAGVPAGVRISAPVSLRDLPATILELTGTERSLLPGSSLSRYWNVPGGLAIPDLVVSSEGASVSLVDEQYHYTRDEDGREKLFAYRTDIFEQDDLAGTPGTEQILQRFRKAIPRDFIAGD